MTVSMIIGGGQSQRMGQDKSRLEIDGRTLLESAIDSLSFSAEILVIAPPSELRESPSWPPVRFTIEDPPFGGPVAGLVAGIAAWSARPDSEHVIVFPVDMPNPRAAAGHLQAAELAPDFDGAVLQDEQGWPQYLLGRYRMSALRRAAQQLGSGRDISMRKFGKLLNVSPIPVANFDLVDVDTPTDAKAHGIAVKTKKRKDDPEVLARLEQWQKALRAELKISDDVFDQERILDLAAIIAKDVARPGVPITGYLVGIAVGRAIEQGVNPQAALDAALKIAGDPAALLGQGD